MIAIKNNLVAILVLIFISFTLLILIRHTYDNHKKELSNLQNKIEKLENRVEELEKWS